MLTAPPCEDYVAFTCETDQPEFALLGSGSDGEVINDAHEALCTQWTAPCNMTEVILKLKILDFNFLWEYEVSDISLMVQGVTMIKIRIGETMFEWV